MGLVRGFGVGLCVIGIAVTLAGCDRGGNEDTSGDAAEPTVPPVVASSEVTAEARVVPVRGATLSLPGGGTVTRVLVEPGDVVDAGAILVRVDGAAQAAAVMQAAANVDAAEAQLAKLAREPSARSLADADAAVAAAEAGVQGAGGSVASARASLNRVQAGASGEDLAIAAQRIEQAKNYLWGMQGRRDSVCGRVEDGFGEQSDCDAAEAEVGRSYEDVRIAELQLAQLSGGPRSEDVAGALAALQQAQGQLSAAQAELLRAEVNHDRVLDGPSEEDLRASNAAVDQARAVLEAAQLAVDDTVLRAPFAGTVVSVDVRDHGAVAPGVPVVWMIDDSGWQIETDDLTELDVVKVVEGAPALVRFDALPNVELEGTVTSIGGVGENKLGDITYTVVVTPDSHDDRLRWNMTAAVIIAPE